jgi:hypothetical protein
LGGVAVLFEVDVEEISAGTTARGTSFPLGNGLGLTARHVEVKKSAPARNAALEPWQSFPPRMDRL